MIASLDHIFCSIIRVFIMSRRKKSGNIFVSVGLPMLGFVIIGGGSLSVFMQHHFELKDRVHSSISERKFDLKKEHEKMIKDLVRMEELLWKY